MSKNINNSTEFGNALLASSLQFFKKTLENYTNDSKASIMAFATATELSLKSLLCFEHWSLVFADMRDINLNKLRDGSAKTIQASGLTLRLKSVLDIPINNAAEDAFSALFSHRNKIVHFIHEELEGDRRNKSIDKNLQSSWYNLKEILLQYFPESADTKLRDELNAIIKEIRRRKNFYEFEYNEKKDEIIELIQNGEKPYLCPVCEYESMFDDGIHVQQNRDISVHTFSCMVCTHAQYRPEIICQKCGEKQILTFSKSSEVCKHNECGRILSSPIEQDENLICIDCHNSEIMFLEQEEMYFCFSCGESSNTTSVCGYCTQHYLGDVSDESYLYGCELCDGSIANSRD